MVNSVCRIGSLVMHSVLYLVLVLPSQDSGLDHTHGARGLRKSVGGDSGEGEEEWIDPALLAVLAGEEGPATVKTWEGWEERWALL